MNTACRRTGRSPSRGSMPRVPRPALSLAHGLPEHFLDLVHAFLQARTNTRIVDLLTLVGRVIQSPVAFEHRVHRIHHGGHIRFTQLGRIGQPRQRFQQMAHCVQRFVHIIHVPLLQSLLDLPVLDLEGGDRRLEIPRQFVGMVVGMHIIAGMGMIVIVGAGMVMIVAVVCGGNWVGLWSPPVGTTAAGQANRDQKDQGRKTPSRTMCFIRETPERIDRGS